MSTHTKCWLIVCASSTENINIIRSERASELLLCSLLNGCERWSTCSHILYVAHIYRAESKQTNTTMILCAHWKMIFNIISYIVWPPFFTSLSLTPFHANYESIACSFTRLPNNVQFIAHTLYRWTHGTLHLCTTNDHHFRWMCVFFCMRAAFSSVWWNAKHSFHSIVKFLRLINGPLLNV